MTDETDMTVSVTRGEMHQAFETWTKVIIDGLTATMAAMIAASEQRIKTEITTLLSAEIGRATRASNEELELRLRPMWMAAVGVSYEQSRQELRAIDDQYKSLPQRVERLEDAVFKPKPKRRAKG